MPDGRRADVFVERDAELARLEELLDRALEGRGQFAVVTGPAGIGKTRLVATVSDEARHRGLRVLRARGGPVERDTPFAAVQELFAPLLSPPARRRKLLAGAARHALPAFAPTNEADGAHGSLSVLHGLYWLVANLTLERPLLIAVDDVDAVDPASTRFLAYLAERLEDLPLLLVAVAGSSESWAPATAELVARARDGLVVPTPLSELGVTQLVRDELGVEAETARRLAPICHKLTGGNPLLVRTLVSTLDRPYDPDALEAVRPLALRRVAHLILPRIARRGGDAVRLAAALAVLGDDVELQLAARVAGLRESDAREAADALTTGHILRSERPLAFEHPVVRDAVYDDLPPGRRSELHRTAASVLSEMGDRTRIARHLLASEPSASPAVVAALRDAARDAVRRGAPDHAVTLLRRALAEPPEEGERVPLLLEAGAVAHEVGDSRAEDWLCAALDAGGAPDVVADAAVALAKVALVTGTTSQVTDRIQSALDVVGDDRESLLLVRSALVLALGLGRGLSGMAHEQAVELAKLAPCGATRGERLALVALAYDALASGATAPEVADRAARAYGGNAFALEPGEGSALHAVALGCLIYADDLDRAAAICTAAMQLARAEGAPAAFCLSSAARALVNLRLGHLDETEADATSVLDADAGTSVPLATTAATALLTNVRLEQGRLEEAATLVAADDDGRPVLSGPFLDEVRARVRLARREPSDALEHLRACQATQEAMGIALPSVSPWRSLAAQAHLALDERDTARALAAEEVELARAFGARIALGAALRVQANVLGGTAGLDSGREAVEVLAGSPASLELARAQVDLGAALRRSNQRAEARDWLRLGLDGAARCGAYALARRAGDELRATGARPRRLMLRGADALTPTELRVARLAADGLSNREIAQELFVTPKTIETHLGSAYRKLEISSRADLASALAQERA